MSTLLPISRDTVSHQVAPRSVKQIFVVLVGLKEMSRSPESLGQQYAAEVMQAKADEVLLQRL